MTDAGPDAPPVRLLRKGNFANPGEEIAPGFLSVLGPTELPQASPTGRDHRPPQGPGRLGDPPRPPLDRPGDGQPALARAFRPGDRLHARRLRHPGGLAQPPRTARLAGHRIRRPGLEPEGHAPPDGDERDLPPVEHAAGEDPGGRPRQCPVRPDAPAAAGGGGGPRRLAGRLGPARRAGRRPERLPRPARRASRPGRGLARPASARPTGTGGACTSSSSGTSSSRSSTPSTCPTRT